MSDTRREDNGFFLLYHNTAETKPGIEKPEIHRPNPGAANGPISASPAAMPCWRRHRRCGAAELSATGTGARRSALSGSTSPAQLRIEEFRTEVLAV